MIDYKSASKDQLKAEMKRLAAVVPDVPFQKGIFQKFSSGMMDGNTGLITLTDKK